MTAPPKPRRHGSHTLDYRRHDGPVALAAEILQGSANLRGARCVDYVAEVDPDVRGADIGYEDEADRWAICNLVCRACPARGDCWAWAQSTPPNRRPVGPLAITVANPFPVIRARRRRVVPLPAPPRPVHRLGAVPEPAGNHPSTGVGGGGDSVRRNMLPHCASPFMAAADDGEGGTNHQLKTPSRGSAGTARETNADSGPFFPVGALT